MFCTLTIEGFRGFSTKEQLDFAPLGPGKVGLTVLVGANNTGKSTVIEAIRAISQNDPPTFSQGRRNISSGDKVCITLNDDSGVEYCLKSRRPGTSEVTASPDSIRRLSEKILVLPSRRVFSPFFARHVATRHSYMNHIGFPPYRTSQLDQFAFRLFNADINRETFDPLLKEVLGYEMQWSIDQSDQGNHFLKITNVDGAVHTSEGMGEGLISLMYIVDALYDSSPGDMIVIDEPELSLHPQYQKNLLNLIVRYAADRQIVISTHSPYFVDLSLLTQGLALYRTTTGSGGTRLCRLGESASSHLGGLLRNDNNPHILGVTAREILFSGDGVLLLEGQDDVVFLERVLADLGLNLSAHMYGWGVGGAENMQAIAEMLKDLGFEKVIGILDYDKSHRLKILSERMPGFFFGVIPANDIRTKKATKAKDAVNGLLDDSNVSVRDEYVEDTRVLFDHVDEYLKN